MIASASPRPACCDGDAETTAATLYAIGTETTYLRRNLPPDDYARWLAALLSQSSKRVAPSRAPSPGTSVRSSTSAPK